MTPITDAFPRSLRPRIGIRYENKRRAAYRVGYEAGYHAGQRYLLRKLARVTESQRISSICEIVAAHFGIEEQGIISHSRIQRFAQPRHVAMYLARELTPQSFPTIGRYFGGRDHTTVMNACRRIQAKIQADPEFAAEVVALAQAIAVHAGTAA